MKIDLLTYYTSVLDKISLVDRSVFRKELRKAFRNLLPEEREQLKQWFRTTCVCKVDLAGETMLPATVRVESTVN